MCESSVYLKEGKSRVKIMDEALLIEDDGEKINIVGILGDRKEIMNGKIVKLDMGKHEVLIIKK